MMRDITTDELRRMDDSEGLILQGCGGDPQEWVDGINELLTDAGILRGGECRACLSKEICVRAVQRRFRRRL